MTKDLPLPALGLSPQEAQARFEALQAKLVPLWRSIETFNQDEQTIVVVPSLTVEFTLTSAQQRAYEERFLFLLLLLRQPRARLVYVTSQAIHPSVVDYHLELLPGIISSHARNRLFLVSPLDGSPRPLSRKLLERPQLLERIRRLIPDPDRAHLVPFNTTELERDLALRLGIPMYGADPRFLVYGSKSGCRRLFADEGVAHPAGRENLRSAAGVVEAIREMRADGGEGPAMKQVLVKLNEGVSGEGNALVDLRGLPEPGHSDEHGALSRRVREMRFEAESMDFDRFTDRLRRNGGVVEARVMGDELRSPSVQLRVTPTGEAEVLSTHDQVLGGPSGQTFLGSRFPADAEYAAAITAEARKVGARLAREGVLGRFAVDFVVVRTASGSWDPYAIEINLRKGGTTHPYLTLQFLTDGVYRPDEAVFTTPAGTKKYFVASDYLHSHRYRVFTPDDLFDIVVRHELHYSYARQTGVVLHMMSAVAELGRLGLTAVGDTPEEADAFYRRAVSALDEEATRALAVPELPPVGG